MYSVWYETLIFHSASVESVKFKVVVERSRNACEVFKARGVPKLRDDCFEHERIACFDRRRKLAEHSEYVNTF
jgi:hypothetical protein